MDPNSLRSSTCFEIILPLTTIIVALASADRFSTTGSGSRTATRCRIRWGMPIHPKTDQETAERIKLLTSENAQLRAELGSIKDRLETLERIATDQPARLAREIDALASTREGMRNERTG